MKNSIEAYLEAFKDYQPDGEILKVYTYPSPVLKKIAEPVVSFDEELKTLCLNMLNTMYKAPGIGLAAPQVGESIRLFVMDIDYERDKVANFDGSIEHKLSKFNPLIFINPEITKGNEEIIYQEGCLSVPGIYEDVKRSSQISLSFQDWNGDRHKLEATELLSVCIQHENDHLDGIVFLERLSLIKRNLLMKKFLKTKKTKKKNA
jgi:peptide deformylase